MHRDNNIYHQKFTSTDEGATADTDVEIIGKCEDTGTIITYIPDPKVYGEEVFIDIDSLRQMLSEMSMFSTGLSIELIVDKKKKAFLKKWSY